MLAYVVYMVCRILFVIENWTLLSTNFQDLSIWLLIKGSLLFDTSGILYTNAIYALMLLLPCHLAERPKWFKAAKYVYIIINSISIILNLADAVYFTYTGHRTTTSVFSEFSNENNLGGIFFLELVKHWYLVLAAVAMIFFLWRYYTCPKMYSFGKKRAWNYIFYYVANITVLVFYTVLCVVGMRGGFTVATRPITISNANQYVNHPIETGIVLNTPFSLIRTIGKNVFEDPGYFSQRKLDKIYSPVRNEKYPIRGKASVAKKKNVVIIIVESLGREYIGKYNDGILKSGYRGYTPFIDELIGKSLTFDYTFANGRQSIDAMPSILSSIPRFIEPFFLTPSSLNDVSGIAGELRKCGYQTAFFHGAENGSMGFEAYARTTGYKNYYGRTEFNKDSRFRGDHDYDGTWAIWDEPFLQFYAKTMTSMMHKCVRYTDMALHRFFDTASKQPWFKNTIFVITADHTNILDHPEYATDLGLFMVPIIFYDPSGELPRGRMHCVAQQIDIMPTLLQYMGYNKPYIAFGNDLLNTPADKTWAVNHTGGGIYQYVKGDYVIQFDGDDVIAAYDFKNDWMMQHNLLGTMKFKQMEKELKAIIQSYMQRMIDNELVVRAKEKE